MPAARSGPPGPGSCYSPPMRRGQSTVEYLLLASVLSIALVAILELTGEVATDSAEELGKSMAESLTTDGVRG